MAKRASATVGRMPRAPSASAALQALGQPGAEGQDRHPLALQYDPPPADLERHAALGQLDADALAAREAERARPVVDRHGGRHHVHQLGLVGRGHHHEVRQAGEVGDVEGAGMGRPVGADQPGAVDGEAHRQALDRHVVHHLVVAALQEGRVDRRERLHPGRRHPGAEGHRVLLGDADVEAALRKALGEQVEPGAVRHRRGHRHDPVVGLRLADQRLARTPWCRTARWRASSAAPR